MQTVANEPDDALLAEFSANRSAPAFDELVRRHGGLVYGACLRTLGQMQDAEDAAQATFLTLALKARELHGRASVAGWLYLTAVRIASDARKARRRRQAREERAVRMNPPETAATAPVAVPPEFRAALDEELAALPASMRDALLLHHLEGQTVENVASALRRPAGTVAAWLSRGREKLKDRLARRGVFLSVGTVGVLLAAEAQATALPPVLANSMAKVAVLAATGHALAAVSGGSGVISAHVATLTQGALKAMFCVKLKVAATVLAAVSLTSAAGVTTYHALAGEPARPPVETAAAPAPDGGAPAPDLGKPPEKGDADATVKDGLAFTAIPVNKVSLDVEPLTFFVTLKNVSENAFWLHDPKHAPAYQVKAGNWLAKRELKDDHVAVRELLKPGESFQFPLSLEGFTWHWTGIQKKPVPPRASLPPGRHEVQVLRNFPQYSRKWLEKELPWYGEIAGKPVSIEVVDRGGAIFQQLAKYAAVAGKGKVKSIEAQGGGKTCLVSLGPCTHIYRQPADPKALTKARPDDVKLPADVAQKFGVGDEILFVRDHLFDYDGEEAAVAWSAAEEEALRRALAPGWKWTDREFLCPWCRWAPPQPADGLSKAPECALAGKCQTCPRSIGPATRKAALGLYARDVRNGGHDPLSSLNVRPGEAPTLCVKALVGDDVKEGVPEFTCGSGSLSCHSDLFFLVREPGGREDVVFPVPRKSPEPESVIVGPLHMSVTQIVLVDPKLASGYGTFPNNGPYEVRAAAGRLQSIGLVTVTVGASWAERYLGNAERLLAAGEIEGARASAEKALGFNPTPEQAARANKVLGTAKPAAASEIAPRFTPGEKVLSGVEAASGKMVWQVQLPFEIGWAMLATVQKDGQAAARDTLEANSIDGKQKVILDAKSGKLIEHRMGDFPVPQKGPPKPTPEDGF